jgi:hypothetical protein
MRRRYPRLTLVRLLLASRQKQPLSVQPTSAILTVTVKPGCRRHDMKRLSAGGNERSLVGGQRIASLWGRGEEFQPSFSPADVGPLPCRSARETQHRNN